jgi:ABC-type uncharacterized transport system permease subunit
MFNFIAAALMTHLLVNVLIKPGQQSPETREFAPSTWLPQLHDVARALGCEIGRSPVNLSLPWLSPPAPWSGSISGARAGAMSSEPSATTRRRPSTAASSCADVHRGDVDLGSARRGS